jgi:peptidoglycan-N-acetylglucosamine deacetylase
MTRAVWFLILVLATHASLLMLFTLNLRAAILSAAGYSFGTLLILYLLFHPRNQWLVPNRSQVECNGSRCVALTFDDGPTPVRTPRLLDILREKNVRATFFVVGKRVEESPEIVRRAQAEGHLIATHTWSHPHLFCFLTPARLRAEIHQGLEAVGRVCGIRPRYFRSPVGLRHPLLRPYLKAAGLEYVSWTIRSRDTLAPAPETLMQRVLGKVTAGDIILFHDNASAGSETMLEVLPGVIDELRKRGFEFVLVG